MNKGMPPNPDQRVRYTVLRREQLEKIRELTVNFDPDFYLEKRSVDARFHPGVLIPDDARLEPIQVRVSDETMREDGRVLVAQQAFPDINPADLICELDSGEKIRMNGWAEASRPGRRKEDKEHDPPLHYSYFYPKLWE